jgi:hypothetical protein
MVFFMLFEKPTLKWFVSKIQWKPPYMDEMIQNTYIY